MSKLKELNQDRFRKCLVVAFFVIGLLNVLKVTTNQQSLVLLNIVLSIWALIYGLHYFANHNHRKGSIMMLVLGLLVVSMFL